MKIFNLKKFFEEKQHKQNLIRAKKINFLKQKAYEYHLGQYLKRVTELKIVDLHPGLYEAGVIICDVAKYAAEKDIEKIIKNNSIDKCFAKYVKELKRMA